MTGVSVGRTDRQTGRLAERWESALVSGPKVLTSANDSVPSEVSPRTVAAAYSRPSRLKRAADQLSERDWAILRSLGLVRLLTALQLQRLHFREGSPLTRARRARRSLARLHELHLVHRLERRIGGLHAGSSGFIYALTGWGQRLLGGTGPAGGSRRRRGWEPSSPFQDHILAVSELYVQLVESAADGSCELITFEAEPTCWRGFTGLDGVVEVLKPDAYVVTADEQYEYVSFVEVDRGTEGLRALQRKVETYVDYARCGDEVKRLGVFPFVVWLVPDETRIERVRQALAEAKDAAGGFKVGLLSAAAGLLVGDTAGSGAETASK